MRKHGWQLPYHPLQVVAIAVFLALGFSFYVFFVPFVGRKLFQYVVMGLYTPLVACVFVLYIWCAATDPGDPGVFKSKKYLKSRDSKKQNHNMESQHLGPNSERYSGITEGKPLDDGVSTAASVEKCNRPEDKNSSCCGRLLLGLQLIWCPLAFLCRSCHPHEPSSEQQMNEEGMFFCSLCEVEVLKYSKHCRVCDKCVDSFDHHCRWLNNCIGRRNYRRFFVLMFSSLLLLILQWSIGVLVLILCFLERKKFSVDIVLKLGSSFSLLPYVVVVVSCTLLAMVATLPLAQLFFFHILLVKKGISTYDYIIALREQEQQEVGGGQQSPQMSTVSSLTGFSSASSFGAFHRGAWCTPPRLFLEDQSDGIPPEIGTSQSYLGKITREEGTKRKGAGTVKISPWALAHLNAEEVTKASAQARKRSQVIRPIARLVEQEMNDACGNASGRIIPRPDNKRRPNKPRRILSDHTFEPLTKISASATDSNGSDMVLETPGSLAPLQLEARSAFQPSIAASSPRMGASSPDSSLDSPDLHPFSNSSSAIDDSQLHAALPVAGTSVQKGVIQLSRSTSDGYEASGGEDSDRIPSRIVHRSSNWANVALNSDRSGTTADMNAPSNTRLL